MGNNGQCINDVIVIGAGISGLAVAYELRQRGISVRIIDKAKRPGEAWHHRHPQLRLNTHRLLSRLPGMKIPKAVGAFPSRDSIISYIETYAAKLDVPIDYGIKVNHIKRSGKNWVVDTDSEIYVASYVVVATGFDSEPHIPDWIGRQKFKKKLIHAADFGDVKNYIGKKVLVVGAGNSGTDVLNHLSAVETETIWVSVRHGPVVFPTRLYGIPVQLLSPVLSMLPVSVVDSMLKLTEYLAFGKLKKWGLNKHPDGGATRLLKQGIAPAIDNGFISALKAGKVEVVSQVKTLGKDFVKLVDGKLITPDVVIAATGYRTGLEQILLVPGILNELGVPTINGDQQLKDNRGLFFTGMRPALPGVFMAAGETGRKIACAIDAEMQLTQCPTSENIILRKV